jgi:hypothetical protein
MTSPTGGNHRAGASALSDAPARHSIVRWLPGGGRSTGYEADQVRGASVAHGEVRT